MCAFVGFLAARLLSFYVCCVAVCCNALPCVVDVYGGLLCLYLLSVGSLFRFNVCLFVLFAFALFSCALVQPRKANHCISILDLGRCRPSNVKKNRTIWAT